MSMEYMIELIDKGISTMSELSRIDLDKPPFDLTEFRHCIVMELIKDAYYESEPKASLRSYIEEGSKDSDDIRMRYQRMMKYAQHYRSLWHDQIKAKAGYGPKALLPDDMSDIEKKLSGHKVTPMQYFELSTMADHALFKAIVNKRICSTKKVSNTEFEELMADYDALVQTILERWEDEPVFATIALYTLEWKYDVELFYGCAVEAERRKTKEIPKDKLSGLCAELSVPHIFDPTKVFYLQSRFIKYRRTLIPALYDGSDWGDTEFKLLMYFNIFHWVKNQPTQLGTMPELFKVLTKPEDWGKYIKENYNLHSVFEKKEWTPTRIRYMRSLYDTMVQNLPTPKL